MAAWGVSSCWLYSAGAATPDIIAQYVGCIKALREVDPAGILLNAVGRPIKAYLRSRKDTIRCIVASLTEEAEGGESPHAESLAEELKQPPEPEVHAYLLLRRHSSHLRLRLVLPSSQLLQDSAVALASWRVM